MKIKKTIAAALAGIFMALIIAMPVQAVEVPNAMKTFQKLFDEY